MSAPRAGGGRSWWMTWGDIAVTALAVGYVAFRCGYRVASRAARGVNTAAPAAPDDPVQPLVAAPVTIPTVRTEPESPPGPSLPPRRVSRARRGIRRRWVAVLSVVGLVALVVSYLAYQQAYATGGTLSGTSLGETPAPAFQAVDQNGAMTSLASLHGKAVVLTFLYTSCPDICPLTAQKMHAAYLQLSPSQRSRVALVAVTVDPKRDTPARLRQFIAAEGLTGEIRFLTGLEQNLAPIWRAYGIGVSDVASGSNPDVYTVNHTPALYVIDAQGRERTLLNDQDFTPGQLAHDLQIVAGSA